MYKYKYKNIYISKNKKKELINLPVYSSFRRQDMVNENQVQQMKAKFFLQDVMIHPKFEFVLFQVYMNK